MSWNTIIFDLDGTLLNSLEDIRDSANYTMRKMGFPEKGREEIKGAVGNGVRHLLTSCIPQEQKADDHAQQGPHEQESRQGPQGGIVQDAAAPSRERILAGGAYPGGKCFPLKHFGDHGSGCDQDAV